MMPMPVPPPPVQRARFQPGFIQPPAPTMRQQLVPMPPPGSRIDPRPTVVNRWGHFAGLGNDTDRMVVPARSAEGTSIGPLACAVIGFVAYGLLGKS